MTCRVGLARFFFALFLIAVALTSCSKTSTPSATPEKPRVEADLALVTLTKKEVASLSIESRPITTKPVQEFLPLTGWIMAKQGCEVTITAPVSGYVQAPSKISDQPLPGLPIHLQRELFQLQPVLSPVEQLQVAALERSVKSELNKAGATLKLAKLELKIVQDLFTQEIKKEQEVEQAKVRLKHAEEDLAAAKDKLALFTKSTISIRAPQSGTAVMVHVSPGQFVTAAAPLVTIVDLSILWVRVPVPEQDLLELDRKQGTAVALRNDRGNPASGKRAVSWKQLYPAQPVSVVPQVDPARHTADLIYEMSPYSCSVHVREIAGSAGDGARPFGLPPLRHPSFTSRNPLAFAKDQMVTVFVPQGRVRTESTVPYAAVVFDAHGSAWIYLDRTKDGEPRYLRRRVELGYPVADGVVVRSAGLVGENVVTVGAAILFSREFHHTGVKLEDLDDD